MIARRFAWALAGLCLTTSAFAIDVDRKDVSAFIDEMVQKHDFDRSELRTVLAAADVKQSILDAISRPA